ncbi:MAG: DUF3224 domain-containing protein [Chloroflexota bacterium]
MATNQANGSFSVKLTPQAPDAPSDNTAIGRMLLDKQFMGDLEAHSVGQMLAATNTAVPDSAGYVAIEEVTGTLNGRAGSFKLQHYGLLNRGEQQLIITVIPDSGTGQLTGLSGSMTITVTEEEHLYNFMYTI